jgi:chromosome segregation ATPase
MNYLDRNTLPRFQERLDLAASELNDMEDIYVKAINELAGRMHIVSAMLPAEQRSEYAEEVSYPILDKLTEIQNKLNQIDTTLTSLQSQIDTFDNRYLDFDRRLNALDDAAARKEDLNILLYRSGHEE